MYGRAVLLTIAKPRARGFAIARTLEGPRSHRTMGAPLSLRHKTNWNCEGGRGEEEAVKEKVAKTRMREEKAET